MSHQENLKMKWYYNPWFVILSIFLLLGPFGYPFLFKSPAFSKFSKWLIVIISMSLFIWILMGILSSLEQILERFMDQQMAVQMSNR